MTNQIDTTALIKELRELTAANLHSEAVKRLSDEFGTPIEQQIAYDIYEAHMERGFINGDEQDDRRKCLHQLLDTVKDTCPADVYQQINNAF